MTINGIKKEPIKGELTELIKLILQFYTYDLETITKYIYQL